MTTDKLVLTKKEMKEYGYKVIDAIVEHYDSQDDKKPIAKASRDEMDSIFSSVAPEQPADFNEVLEFVLDNVMPYSNVVTHPKFFSFVPGPSNYISTIADTLATGFNVFSGSWSNAPSASELEIITLGWLLKLFKLPAKQGGGIFTSGGSMANLTALATARKQKLGEHSTKAIIYLSDQAHSSNIKAIRILGFTKEQVRIIPSDYDFKMIINKLKNAIAKDRLEGFTPFCVIASAGTTNTGTVDPLNEIATICKAENLWYHIDGAYGGAAILADKGKAALKGIEKADSLTIDPHKWLFQPYEMGCLLVRNHKWLSSTFSEKPEYLRDIEGNKSEINFYDYGIQLTRRFRALKLYMSIKTFGLHAFKEAVTYTIELAEQAEDLLRKSALWEVVSPANIGIINFRYNPIHLSLPENEIDALNQKISEALTNSREALMVTTILLGKVVLRMCLINPRTTLNDVKETIEQCEGFAEKFL